MMLTYLIPGLAVPGTPWHVAGLIETLQWTGEVVEVDRLAPNDPCPGRNPPSITGFVRSTTHRKTILGYG